MKLIRRIYLYFITFRIRKFFNKLKPVTESYLSRWGNLYNVSRIIYEEQCEESCDYYVVGISGVNLGYPEKDEHLRKRIMESIRS